MSDPRAENCKAYHLDASGKVDGVELRYVEHPDAKYQLMRVTLISEADAAGNTVASFSVLDQNGIEAPEKVFLAWPFPNYEGRGLPGNQNRQHMIINKYPAPSSLGPLAIYVGDNAGKPISDEIGGLGLPNGRHVSFTLTFKERGSSPEPEPEPGAGDLVKLEEELWHVHDDLHTLAAHLGCEL